MTTTDPKLIERIARAMSADTRINVAWEDMPEADRAELVDFLTRTAGPILAAAINEAVQNERAGTLETVLNIRAANAGNFDREGAAWEAYDRACLDIHAAIEAHKESGHG